MKISELRSVFMLLLLMVFTGVVTGAFAAKTELSEDAVRVADEIRLRNLRATMARLTALPSRVTGYEAGENAAKYIFDEFQRIGLEDVDSQEYEITVPIDHEDGRLRVLGSDGIEVMKELKLLCLWPNLVRTSFLPKGIKHKVKEDDTLESIAAAYGLPIHKILAHEYNSYLKDQASDKRDNDADGEIDEEGELVLFPDKDILIPIPGITGRLIYASSAGLSDFNDKEVGGKWYEIKPNDTIDNIAYSHRVSVGSILDDILNLHLDKTNDDIDNDNDGNIDEDGEMPLMEDIANWNNDGIDNDNDGLIDEIPGNNHDGIDNDRDGMIDEDGEFVEASESSIFVPQGAIVLLDFNCTVKWINAAMLGARAVIFIEPEDTIRGEAEAKFLTIPAAIPRFWISKEDADYLIKDLLSTKHTIKAGDTLESISEQYGVLLEDIGRYKYNDAVMKSLQGMFLPEGEDLYIPDGGAKKDVTVQLVATMTWEQKLGQNISGLLIGVDPDLKGELVVIQAYFDSMSVVPADAPGADPTGGIAALLEIARVLSLEENRPGRSVLFLATSGHFQGLAGMRAFMYGVSEDLVKTMYELRDDLYNELREVRALGRRIVLAIGKGLLVELPPSFFERVRNLETKLWSVRNDTLPELNNIRNTIASLRNNKRDEIEKRKEKREQTRKREEQKFTPEDQARLEALTAKATADAIQTAYHFEELVDELIVLKEEAIRKCREEEKAIIRNYALPIARMDLQGVAKLKERHKKLNAYTTRHPWLYGNKEGEEDPVLLIEKLQQIARDYGGEMVIKNDLIFDVELKYQGDLDNGNISESLRQEFENNGILLSQDATVSTEKEDGKWLITDDEKRCHISTKDDKGKENGKLNIYRASTDMGDKDVEELLKQYSPGKIADRHLDALEYMRLKKARGILWEKDENRNYNDEEIGLLERVSGIVQTRRESDIPKLSVLLKRLGDISDLNELLAKLATVELGKAQAYTESELALIEKYFSSEGAETLEKLRQQLIDLGEENLAEGNINRLLLEERETLKQARDKAQEQYTETELELIGAHLFSDKIERLRELRRRVIDVKGDSRKYLAKEKDILMLVRYNAQNAPRLIERLLDLAKQYKLTREYTTEEARVLEHNLGKKDYGILWNKDKTGARQVLFSEYDEGQLLDKMRSRAVNDVADLEAFLDLVDTIDRPTTEQEKVLIRDNLPTLRNSRARNIHKKIGIFSRVGKEEYERKISLLMQVIDLQDKFNRYYSSLFISIDISTQNDQLGLFGKGWFYDQQPEFVLRREFASIGNKCSEYANNASFGRSIHALKAFTDDQVRRSAIAGQWGAAASTKDIEAIEGKTLESLVADHYDTLVGLGGVNRLMKLQFKDMKDRGEPSKEMLKDMDYLRKEVARFIRTAIRDKRKSRKAKITQYRKLNEMLELKDLRPEELTPEETEDVATLVELAGLGGGGGFVNAISATGGKTWRTYIPGKIAFDSEVATLAGKTGIAFATINDARVLTDTPLDTLDRVDFENLLTQTKMLASILVQVLRDPEMPTAAKVGNYYCTLYGNVVEFDAKESPIPNTPVPGTIMTVRRRHKTMMGVRGDLFTMSDSKGKYQISGLGMEGRAVNRPGRLQEVEAYKLDAESGDISYAPDKGVYGAKIFDNRIPINTRRKGRRIVVFPCVSTTIYDLVDQRYYRTLKELSVYDAVTDGEPMMYGFSKPWPQPMVSSVEPIALVYSKAGSRIKIGMGAGLLGKRLLLIKADATDEEAEAKPTLYTGKGFIARENGSIRVTPYVVVRDMWALDESRGDLYKRYGISNDRLDNLHEMANVYLKKARILLGAEKYDEALKLARAAWGYESRAYPDIKGTGNDVVKGVMFYLAILIPFAFFMERLLFHFPNIHKQVGATFIIFLLVFFMLSQVHPAFQITVTPLIILLAFVVLALSVMVIVIIIRKFEEQLEKMKSETSKIYKADVGRLSASAAAFALGISNMRKRKSRTILTCGTLVILTFTVISFTSVRTFMQSNKTRLPSVRPSYTGMLIRNQYWHSLEEPLYTSIKNDLESTEIELDEGGTIEVQNPISARSWYFSSSLGDQSFVDLVADNGKKFTATALLGMSDTEPGVTGIDRSLKWGRWFKSGETYAVILPAGMADALEITENEVSSGSMGIKIGGGTYIVVGVLDTSFKDIKDLDGEELTPVDYLLMQQQHARGLQMGGETLEGELQKYLHLTPQQIAILPYQVVMNMGGNLKSVAVKMSGSSRGEVQLTAEKELDKIMADLMPRIALDVFVGNMETNNAYLYSSIGMTSFSGMSNLFVPILIAALIVLNTMLGAVYERVREISIYSAVGLAPVHIAFLFIAEACVYAIIGGILGYLLGQGTAWALVRWDLLSGLTLNYSSMSTVSSTIIVMLVVLGSTIYPAVKASRMAVPDIERKWRLPDPDGDEWHFDLPFTVLSEEALGLNIFMRDYFEAHADESASDFYTDQVNFGRKKLSVDEEEYAIEMMVWLAPYDLGVSQGIALMTVPAGQEEDKDLYKIYLQVHRESGEIASWKRVNRRFLNLLRKQFLIWRTFNVAIRNEFHERGRQEDISIASMEPMEPEPAG